MRLCARRQGLTGKSIEETSAGLSTGRRSLTQRLSQRTDLGDVVDRQQSAIDFIDRQPSVRSKEIKARITQERDRRAKLADGEMALDYVRANHAGPIGVKVTQLVVVRFGSSSDHGEWREDQ